MKQANVVFVFNRNYIGQFKVTFCSLKSNHPLIAFSVHLFCHGLNQEEKEDVTRYLQERGASVLFYEIDETVFSGLPKMSYDDSYSAYYKVLIPYLLREKTTYLFFDCDMIIKGDLSPLFENGTGYFLSAVRDEAICRKHKAHVEKITGDRDCGYFNSGLLRFDYAYEDQLVPLEQVMAYLSENRSLIRWHDQDILNHFYGARHGALPERYNYVTVYQSLSDLFVRKGEKDAVIVHYANWKPWKENYIGKCYSLYRKYYRMCEGEAGVDFLKKRKLTAQIAYIFRYIGKCFKKLFA